LLLSSLDLSHTKVYEPRPERKLSRVAAASPPMAYRYFRRSVERFRGGLVFEAHRLLYKSTLGSRVTKKKIQVVSRGRAFFVLSTLEPGVEWCQSL